MTFKEFSRRLIQTKDLDPDYVYMLAEQKKNNLDLDTMVFWCINKVFIYDTASELKYMAGEVTSGNLIYGSERRKNKHNTVEQMASFVKRFRLGDLPTEYNEAREYLKEFDGIGDWAAWKFCDLLERVCGIPIDFSKVDFRRAYLFPLKGLCRVNGEPDEAMRTLTDNLTYEAYMRAAHLQLGDVLELAAPPRFERKINIQEIETCLCKYHSFLSGHYKIGKDTAHLLERLKQEGYELKENLFNL